MSFLNIENRLNELKTKLNIQISNNADDCIGIHKQTLEDFNNFNSAQVHIVYCKEGQEVRKGDTILEITYGGPTIKVTAKKTGVLHLYTEEGENIQIGETLFYIYYQNDDILEGVIRKDYKKLVRKLFFNGTTVTYLLIFIALHFFLSYLVILIPKGIRDFVSIIYLFLTFVLVFGVSHLINLLNKPFYVQEYIQNHGDKLSFWGPHLRGKMIFSILFTICYFGLEAKLIEIFNLI